MPLPDGNDRATAIGCDRGQFAETGNGAYRRERARLRRPRRTRGGSGPTAPPVAPCRGRSRAGLSATRGGRQRWRGCAPGAPPRRSSNADRPARRHRSNRRSRPPQARRRGPRRVAVSDREGRPAGAGDGSPRPRRGPQHRRAPHQMTPGQGRSDRDGAAPPARRRRGASARCSVGVAPAPGSGPR